MNATSGASYAKDGRCTGIRDRGFALITVLWFLALLALIILTISNAVRLDLQAKANLRSHSQAELLADGLVLSLASRLIGQSAHVPVPIVTSNGARIACLLDDAAVEFSVINVAGLVDLNTASVELLARLVAGLGEPATSAEAIAAAIADFRDLDDVRLPRGAEAPQYDAARRGYGPKNAPFETIEELDQVLGVRPDLMIRLREVVTVSSRSPMLDVQVSPPELLRALASNPDDGKTGLFRLAEPLGMSSGTRLRAYVVTVGVRTAEGGRFRRSATIEATPISRRGFSIREWTALPERSQAQPSKGPACATIGLL